MRNPRSWPLFAALVLLVPGLRAQQMTAPPASRPDSAAPRRAYEEQRAALVKALQEAQDQLVQLRVERVQLEARVDSALAHTLARRAELLLLSPEQTALLALDSALALAQDAMLAQRDRMQALGEAVRHRTGAVLVVLLRADSAPPGALGPVALEVDGVGAAERAYSAISAGALQHGAVDELYRAEVLPAAHAVTLTATVAGHAVRAEVTVAVESAAVTYVQFTVRDGQVAPRTWTSRGTPPF